ncbi:nucleoporin Ndc1 [Leptopilina heterotoma]|uniref:nucleoporin Ndc1 n=1 Tax=Leptopilina heterotoma TaxID=63436 RepID=UPI001CA91567|nr:nucleoporin Ndc1 [Leptopilina heterotoma]
MEKVNEINKTGCKELLVWRMFLAIVLSIIFQFFLMSIIILVTNLNPINPFAWMLNTWNVIFSFRMWWYFLLLATVTFLQGFMCSKDYLNPPKYMSNRFFIFCSMLGPRNVLLCTLYIIVGGILTWLHLSLKGGPYSSLTKNCNTTDGLCLVEEYFFLLLGGFWSGLYFFTKYNIYAVQFLQFSIIPQTKFSQIKRAIHELLPGAMSSAVWPALYFTGFYCLFGAYSRSFLMYLIPFSLEDEPLDKISRLLNLSLIFYLWLYGSLFVIMANTMHLMFQASLTEWIPFDIERHSVFNNEKLSITLAEVLAMEDIPIIRQLGYLDLVTLAQKDKSRRGLLFTLSKPGGHPYNWNQIIENCLSTIAEYTVELNSIFSVKEEKQLESELNPSGVYQKPYQYHMRSLAASTTKSMETPPEATSDQFFIRLYKNYKQNVIDYLFSKPLICFIFGEQLDSKARHVLSKSQPIVWAEDAISSLAAVSLTEDPYGIVLKDLPKIIETLLSIKQALDKLQKASVLMRKPVSSDKVLRQCLTSLRSATRRSIYRIVTTFKDFIDDLKLAPEIVDQLHPFFTYRE